MCDFTVPKRAIAMSQSSCHASNGATADALLRMKEVEGDDDDDDYATNEEANEVARHWHSSPTPLHSH